MALHYLSLVTFPIDVIAGTGEKCGTGTGFFYKRDDSGAYVVTNWHVVMGGRDPKNPSSGITGAIPTILKCKLHSKIDDRRTIDLSKRKGFEIHINSDDGNDPQWQEHPTFRHKVDVVAIKIEDIDKIEKECQFGILSDYEDFQEDYRSAPMDDVFVIGYPWGLSGGNDVLPLYKRGSIASEPIVLHGNLPRILIDCRTSQGMSGSPVIVSHSGIWHPDGEMSENTITGTVTNFLGVYSGRFISDELESQQPEKEISEIGIVWRKSAVDEIVDKGIVGTKLSDII